MIFHPGIIALLLGSGLMTTMLGYSAYQGVRIIRGWDIGSGSERQLELERTTYLISTIMAYVMGFQLLSLFLFIYTADTLFPLFVGAMCAAGTLKVNLYGYPALLLKVITCLLSGLWLIVNSADNRAPDYPLIKKKYWILLAIAPLLAAETALQALYLLGLDPEVITSCCGVLFSGEADNFASDLLILPHFLAMALFFLSLPMTMGLGLYVYYKGKGTYLFGGASLMQFCINIAALISVVSVYIYELPTHHCPFCLLHREYHYIGYVYYSVILASGIFGMGVGVIQLFSGYSSLQTIIPSLQKNLARLAVLASAILLLITVYSIVFSNLSM